MSITFLAFIPFAFHLFFRIMPNFSQSNQSMAQNSSQWCPENGGYTTKDPNAYPYRAFGMGRRASFTVIMKVLNSDLDYLCGGGVEGYKIAFHLPTELPHVWKKHYHVSAKQAAIFMVAPNQILTAPTLRQRSPAIRQCYFNAERQLQFFRFYSQYNCESECLANYTLRQCDCVHFAMPRTKEMKICGIRRLKCLSNAESELFVTDAIEKCNCLPSCTTLTYDIEPNLVEYDFLEAWSKSKFPQPQEFSK